MRVRFLEMEEVLQLHEKQLEDFGGTPGIRDLGALQSALAMPEAGMGEDYFHRDHYEMAAAYLFHLCQNHPFVDGNKRVALGACLYFLHVNGHKIMAQNDLYHDLTLQTAAGKRNKTEIAAVLKKALGKR